MKTIDLRALENVCGGVKPQPDGSGCTQCGPRPWPRPRPRPIWNLGGAQAAQE
jgi:hypothetical protein